jgi:hypothetical protein
MSKTSKPKKVEIISERKIYDLKPSPLRYHPDRIEVDVCVKCGAVVFDVIQHDMWHRSLEQEIHTNVQEAIK